MAADPFGFRSATIFYWVGIGFEIPAYLFLMLTEGIQPCTS